MAVAVTTPPLRSSFKFDVTKLVDIENTVAAASKNLRGGKARLYSIHVDNTVTGGSKCWIKIYDISDDNLVAGTSRPIMGFPVPAAGTNPATGLVECEIIDGLEFDNGISVLASLENGNTMTNPPDGQLDGRFVTEDI